MTAHLIKGVVTIAVLFMGASADADFKEFAGQWRNVDANTGGITTLDIGGTLGSGITIHAWGKCHPSDCDWGRVSAAAFGASVTDAAPRVLSAEFPSAASRTTLVIVPESNGLLQVRSLTHFTDNGGRADYTQTATFSRSRIRIRTPVRTLPVTGTLTGNETPAAPSPPTPPAESAGDHHLNADGSVTITDETGTKRTYTRHGMTIVAPDGKVSKAVFQEAPAPILPSFQDGTDTARWLKRHNDALLGVLRQLTAPADLDAYLATEQAQGNPVGVQIADRTHIISWLTQ